MLDPEITVDQADAFKTLSMVGFEILYVSVILGEATWPGRNE